jgi:hypothetical protein
MNRNSLYQLLILAITLSSIQAFDNVFNRTGGATSKNLAYNALKSGYPNLTTSLVIYNVSVNTTVNGTTTKTYLSAPLWSTKWDLLDGYRLYNSSGAENGTYRGFRFHSGKTYSNSSWETIEIDFGKTTIFNRVLFWSMRTTDYPNMYKIEYYNATIKDYLPIFTSYGLGRNYTANNTQVNAYLKANTTMTGGSYNEHNFTNQTTTKIRISIHTIDI